MRQSPSSWRWVGEGATRLSAIYVDLWLVFVCSAGDDKINIFKNLDKETYKSARSTIIDMILATEMTRHFEHLAKFVSVFGSEVEPREVMLRLSSWYI